MQGYAPLIVDKKLPYWDKDHTPGTVMGNQSGCLFFINREGQYRRDESGKIVSISFYKTHKPQHFMRQDQDVEGYELFPELGVIKVRQKIDGNVTYSQFDYYGNIVPNYDVDGRQDGIFWGDKVEAKEGKIEAKEEDDDEEDEYDEARKIDDHYRSVRGVPRVFERLPQGLIAHGCNMIRSCSPSGNIRPCGRETHIVSSKYDYRRVKFPNDKDTFIIDLEYPITPFQGGYIYHGFDSIRNQSGDSYIKINGLMARHFKDEEGRELDLLKHIYTIQDKFLLIQRHGDELYYILDRSGNYIKDSKGEKISSEFPPFYVDGVFLIYPSRSWSESGPSALMRAYFEDGTIVGHEIPDMPSDNRQVIDATRIDLLKRLE